MYEYLKDQFDNEKESKCKSLFEKNNFLNLDDIDIKNNKGLLISDINYIARSISLGFFSVKFDFQKIFNQLIDQIKPQLLEVYLQKNEKGMNLKIQSLNNYLWNQYLPSLGQLFNKYFILTGIWLNMKHQKLDLTFYQYLTCFQDFSNIFTKIQDLSCINELIFYQNGFYSVFPYYDMKFLNLKTITVKNLERELDLVEDANSAYNLRVILNMYHIKPLNFNIKSFMKCYKGSDEMEGYFLNSVYAQQQQELTFNLDLLQDYQIENFFEVDTQKVGNSRKEVEKIKNFNAQQINIKRSDNNESAKDEEFYKKQTSFLKLLLKSKYFSQIKTLDVKEFDLENLKDILQSEIFHESFDVQKFVDSSSRLKEVDEDYFELLSKYKYFSEINDLIIPKFKKTKIKELQNENVVTEEPMIGPKRQEEKEIQKKFKFNFEKFNINKITNLNSIKINEEIEDEDFMLNLFKYDNIRFNTNLNSDQKFKVELSSSYLLKKLFNQTMYGYDWLLPFKILEKHTSIENQVYQSILKNDSTCFLLNQLTFSKEFNKEKAESIISTIITTMKKNKSSYQQYKQKQLQQKNQKQLQQYTTKVHKKQGQDTQTNQQPKLFLMDKLQLNKLNIQSFSEKIDTLKEFFTYTTNLNEINIELDKFSIDQAQVLLENNNNINVAESVINSITKTIEKPDLEKLMKSLKSFNGHKQISFIDFSTNKNIISLKKLGQKADQLKTSQKVKNQNQEDEVEKPHDDDEQQKQNNVIQENDDQNEDENTTQKPKQNPKKGSESDGEDDNQDVKKQSTGQENQEEENQKKIDEMNRISITEKDLSDFLSMLTGVREIIFEKTEVDIYHILKIKDLAYSQLLSFVSVQECLEFKNCMQFLVLIQQDDLKPWFNLERYLNSLPFKSNDDIKLQQKFLRSLFNLKFFKQNIRYQNLEFILKPHHQSQNRNMIDIFEIIIKKRISNLDITALMQLLPPYMKSEVNDYHIQKICQEYGCVHYLQPEKYKGVNNGFNFILQQKRIPISIRLMYLLNTEFQNKISASSLSLVYQLALESDKLKERNIIKESDDQLERQLKKMERRLVKKEKMFKNYKIKIELKIKNEKKKRYLNILNMAFSVGKQNEQIRRSDKYETMNALNKIGQKLNPHPPKEENKKIVKYDYDSSSEGDFRDNAKDCVFNVQVINENQQIREDMGIGDNSPSQSNQNFDKDFDEFIENNSDNKNSQQFESSPISKFDQEKSFDLNENQIKELTKNIEDVLGEQKIDNSKNQEENENINIYEFFNLFEINQNNIEIQEENDDSFNKKGQLSERHSQSGLLKSENSANGTNIQIKQTLEETKEKFIDDNKNLPRNTETNINIHTDTNKFYDLTNKFKNVYEKENEQTVDYFCKYQNPVATKLHKKLVNLHILSQSLKNQDRQIKQIDKKLNEISEKIDIVRFEQQLIRYNQIDQNYEIENLFSFIEALNLWGNNYLNIYGLNFYISKHIEPWIRMNQNISQLKEGKDRTQQIKSDFRQKENDNQISGLFKPDHVLDDKLFEHLSYLIEERLKQLREINLSGLNVSDDFAENFSLLLGDDTKLKHLNLLDLSNNRRLSPFGLKFLFSSIVNRIPDGFKIIISATSNDADNLRLSIELLEKSIMKEAVYVIEREQKKVATAMKQYKKKLNKPLFQNDKQQKLGNKVAPIDRKPTIQLNEMGIDDLKQQIKDQYNGSILRLFEEQLKEEDYQKQISENNDKNICNKDIVDKALEQLDQFSNVSEDNQENMNKNNNELKFLFMEDQTIDSQIVKKLEEDTQFKEKISRLRNLQFAYKKARQESGENGQEQIDARIIIQNIVNLGLYDAINIVIKNTWRRNKLTIIVLSLLLLPLTIFHLIMLSTYKLTYFMKKNEITLRFNIFKSKDDKTTIELDKLIPDNIDNTDFYFDEDVAQIDILLSRNRKKNVVTEIQRRNGRLISQYLTNPAKYDFSNLYKEISTPISNESHILRYVDFILWFHIIIFLLIMIVGYPYYLINQFLPQYYPNPTCGSYPLLFDAPFFFIVIIILGLETAILYDIESIITCKKIFNLKSLTVIILLYNSFMLRYNLYSNMIFAHTIYYCKKAEDLGFISLCFLHIQIAWTVVPAIFRLIQIIIKRQNALRKPVHNTCFINQFTQLTQILDYIGLSFVLDRFSTSSTVTLSGFYIPNFMKYIKIPQILLSKFQKLFYLDFPMISILLIYNLRKNSTSNLLSFENIRVILTTLLSIYSSLSQAWQAHPSVFRTYQMQDFLKFRQDTPQIYKIKIGTIEKFEHYNIQDVISKTFSFHQKYTLKVETEKDIKKNKEKEKEKKVGQENKKKDKEGASSKGQGNSVNGSQVFDNKSSNNISEKSYNSNLGSQSAQSLSQMQNNNQFQGKKKVVIQKENFQNKLLEFIKEKDQLIIDMENIKNVENK